MNYRALLLPLLVLATGGTVAAAQDTERCSIEGSGGQLNVVLPSGRYNSWFGGGVVVRCPAKSIVLKADSLESYGDEGRIFVIGHVDYQEPRLSLTSDFLTYYQRDDRVVATGNVNAQLPSGSTLQGPFAEYYRAIPETRPAARIFANRRPTITIARKDSSGTPEPPTAVVANNITMIGDSLVYAGGAVQVTREDVIARGDSMDLDTERELTVMLGNPSIEGKRDRPFTLGGNRIDLTGRDRRLSRVLSVGRARAVSEDLTLASDTIDLRVSNDLLQRAIAWGPSRARANSPTQQLVADSIDVIMPDQRLREMFAVRGAVAEGRPDSVRFRADTVDWMRGDTIVARFETAATEDTTRRTSLRELIAIGHARSLYHLPPADTTLDRPAINYVVGREIAVDFEDQRVSSVRVMDEAAGVYLEPRAAGEADTNAVVPTAEAGGRPAVPRERERPTGAPAPGAAPSSERPAPAKPPAAAPKGGQAKRPLPTPTRRPDDE